MRRSETYCLLAVFHSFLVLNATLEVEAHESLTPHSHNSSNVLWEAPGNGVVDGMEHHNHMLPIDFGGIFQSGRGPWSALGCWDNGNFRGAPYLTATFDYGHCYIDTYLTDQKVRFSFHGNWPSDGKSAVRAAINKLNALATFYTTVYPHGVTGNTVGIEFEEVSSGGDVQIHWEIGTLPGATAGNIGFGIAIPPGMMLTGYPTRPYTYVAFPSSPYSNFEGWDFSTDASTEDDSKWHFMSIALHEIGHMAGLAHQNDTTDIMYTHVAKRAAPLTSSHLTSRDPRYDFRLDSSLGIYNLYGQTPVQLSPPPTDIQVTWSLGGCHTCDCTEWESNHSAAGATSFTVEHSYSQSGPWQAYSTTSGGVSYPHVGTNGRWFRIKASNTGGFVISVPIFRTGQYCDFCGGGGEEP